MVTSTHQLSNRPALKIVETRELVGESSEGMPAPVVPQTNGAEAGLNVPSTAGEFLEASVAEDGGAGAMATRRGSQHQYRAVLHETIVRVAGALDSQGVCDKMGRLRRPWLSELQGLIREARAIDEMLGLGKKQPEPATNDRHRSTVTVHSDRDSLPDEIDAFLDRMDIHPIDEAG